MIVVKIEMWPRGDEARKRDLARIVIANVGGDHERGDYRFAVSHQLDTKYGAAYANEHALIADGKGAWKRGSVLGFRRQLGAVKLLSAVLREAFR